MASNPCRNPRAQRLHFEASTQHRRKHFSPAPRYVRGMILSTDTLSLIGARMLFRHYFLPLVVILIPKFRTLLS